MPEQNETAPGLREQIAAVFRLNNGQFPAWTKDADPDGYIRAVMAIVQPVIDDLATRASQQAELLGIAEHAGNTAEAAREEAARRAETAEATIARVEEEIRSRHSREKDGTCGECIEFANERHTTYATWPCPTILDLNAALTPPAPADQTEGQGT